MARFENKHEGTIVTTVEQEGEWAGQEVGRVWLKWPACGRGWAWIGVGDVREAALEAERLGSLSAADLAQAFEDA